MSTVTTPGPRPDQQRHRGARGGPPGPRGPRGTDRDATVARIRFRRALALVLMTLLLPGSAQLVAGHRQVGRVALRVWLGCLALTGLVVGLGLLWNGLVFWLVSTPFVLGLVRVVLAVLALGWGLLILDAWRLGRPLELVRRQRLITVGLSGALCLLVAGSLLFASHLVSVQRGLILTMFGSGTATAAEDGRYNVLLLGGDSGEGRWGLRPDSLTVASIDEDTGQTVLFGLPRNLTAFPFPEGSVMAGQFPGGYDCEECTLNSLATWALDNSEVFAGVERPGMQATIEGVEGITGLSINYYALVDMAGFRNLVQAMGGLTLNVRDRIPIGYPAHDWIEPGVQQLNGFETLWFARGRETSDDYSRMARQKCVMSAMMHQLSPQTVLLRFQDLAQASQNLIETDLPASELDTFMDLALKARSQRVSTVSFVPPLVNTGSPDIAKVHQLVGDAFDDGADGEQPAKKKAKRGFSAKKAGDTTGGSLGTLSGGYAANASADLSKAC